MRAINDPKKRKRRENQRRGSAFNPEGEFYNPYKARFARNVKKINPTTRYNLMRDIQEQRAMRGEEGSEVSDLELQKRLNRQAIPKSLLAMIAAGLLGKSAAQGKFASLIYPGQGPL